MYFKFIYLNVCVCAACMCVCTIHVCIACRDQSGSMDPLEPESQIVVSHQSVLGTALTHLSSTVFALTKTTTETQKPDYVGKGLERWLRNYKHVLSHRGPELDSPYSHQVVHKCLYLHLRVHACTHTQTHAHTNAHAQTKIIEFLKSDCMRGSSLVIHFWKAKKGFG